MRICGKSAKRQCIASVERSEHARGFVSWRGSRRVAGEPTGSIPVVALYALFAATRIWTVMWVARSPLTFRTNDVWLL